MVLLRDLHFDAGQGVNPLEGQAAEMSRVDFLAIGSRMSALPSTADIDQGDGYVSFVPDSDVRTITFN
jgi:hypothetical protein